MDNSRAMSPLPSFETLRQAMHDLALNRLASMALPSSAERDALVTLRQVRIQSQALVTLAALDAGLCEPRAGKRLASVWALAGAISAMDDIADGDCCYVPPAHAPGAVVLLQGLSTLLAVDGGVSETGLQASAAGLVRMAAGQSVEVDVDTWSAATYQTIADQIGGHQYVAYLGLLWDGTELQSVMQEIALEIGRVSMVAKDIRSGDRRFFLMPPGDQRLVVEWALAALNSLTERGLRCSAPLVAYAGFALDRPVAAAS